MSLLLADGRQRLPGVAQPLAQIGVARTPGDEAPRFMTMGSARVRRQPRQNRQLASRDTRAFLHIVMVDAATGLVRAHRLVTLSPAPRAPCTTPSGRKRLCRGPGQSGYTDAALCEPSTSATQHNDDLLKRSTAQTFAGTCKQARVPAYLRGVRKNIRNPRSGLRVPRRTFDRLNKPPKLSAMKHQRRARVFPFRRKHKVTRKKAVFPCDIGSR